MACTFLVRKRKRIYITLLTVGIITFMLVYQRLAYSHERYEKRPVDWILEPREGFQPVDNTNHTYVYSAYHDVLDYAFPGFVRIVALTLTKTGKQNYSFSCTFRRDQTEWTTQAVMELIPENHGFRYTGAFIVCPLLSDYIPTSVSVTTSSRPKTPLNHIPVQQYVSGPEDNFKVCVAPLHRQYDNLQQIIEFIEVNRMFGADQIVFYNNSISTRLSAVLRSYALRGIVTVVDWHLPFQAFTKKGGYVNVHYFGQVAAANDCLYRNRHTTRYIVSLDLDEFLVPRTATSWMSLTTEFIIHNPLAAAFVFRCLLFYTFHPNHQSHFPQRNLALKYNSVTLLKTNRTSTALPFNIRPKYLYDPKRVSMVGIHGVIKRIQKYITVKVEVNECAIHHYRNAYVSPHPKGTVIDNFMHSFQDRIIQRINSSLESLANHLN